MEGFLKVGDEFDLKAGMRVHTQLPVRLFYESVLFGDELGWEPVVVGTRYSSRPLCARQEFARSLCAEIEDLLRTAGIGPQAARTAAFVEASLPPLPQDSFTLAPGRFRVLETALRGGAGENPAAGVAAALLEAPGHSVYAVSLEDPSLFVSFHQGGNYCDIVAPQELG